MNITYTDTWSPITVTKIIIDDSLLLKISLLLNLTWILYVIIKYIIYASAWRDEKVR